MAARDWIYDRVDLCPSQFSIIQIPNQDCTIPAEAVFYWDSAIPLQSYSGSIPFEVSRGFFLSQYFKILPYNSVTQAGFQAIPIRALRGEK